MDLEDRLLKMEILFKAYIDKIDHQEKVNINGQMDLFIKVTSRMECVMAWEF